MVKNIISSPVSIGYSLPPAFLVFLAPKEGQGEAKKKVRKRGRTSVVFPGYRSKEQPFSQSVRREHKEIPYRTTHLSCELSDSLIAKSYIIVAAIPWSGGVWRTYFIQSQDSSMKDLQLSQWCSSNIVFLKIYQCFFSKWLRRHVFFQCQIQRHQQVLRMETDIVLQNMTWPVI